MSILTGDHIVAMRNADKLTCSPDDSLVGPNSIDLHLGAKLKVYEKGALSTRTKKKTREITIGPKGYLLKKGEGYLAQTVEPAGSAEFVCYVDGRSSVGRLFLLVHCTAGRGDLGWSCGEDPEVWTLELVPLVRDVRVFAGDRICQATFHTTVGKRTRQYQGRY
jgi:dCTP deaminase